MTWSGAHSKICLFANWEPARDVAGESAGLLFCHTMFTLWPMLSAGVSEWCVQKRQSDIWENRQAGAAAVNINDPLVPDGSPSWESFICDLSCSL